MRTDFQSRHVVVTGGTGALGSAAVGELLARGAVCHVPALTDAEVAAFAHKGHDRVRIVSGVDLTNEQAVASLYEGLGGPLWASLHVAGGFRMAPIERTTTEDYQTMMSMNALTCFLCCREAARRMIGGGRIVNVGARPALFAELGGGMAAYVASKAAVVALTQALASELAPRGILVNAVIPSILDTPANRKAMPDADHAKWPSVSDVARVIADLASPENTVVRAGLVPVYGQS